MKIISGGQTGVDRAALDVARMLGMPMGGWCPRGRRAEDGRISLRYPLRPTPSSTYRQRTEWNVRDSDGTLIIFQDRLVGGTRLTAEYAHRYQRPFIMVDLSHPPSEDWRVVLWWLGVKKIQTLNVAGPRASQSLGIYYHARAFLIDLFSEV